MAAIFTLSSASSIISISPPPHRFLCQRFCSPTTTVTTSFLSVESSQPTVLLRLSSTFARRGISVVTRAGPPSASTYLFAFLFPLSMLLATIFTSIKIDMKLDQDFLEELAVNQGRMEADAEEDESDDDYTKEPVIPLKKPEAARTRNRPKREV